ncbi:MAG: T9SS type A sorting domain-containing protein [Bacteroidota bacterium]
MLVIHLIKKSLILSVLLMSCGFSSFGQNALSSTGGHIKSTGGSTSFTVGQVAYVLKKGNGSYLNEGVQQVYTKKTTPIEELVYLKEVQLYPNPTQETMTLILSSKVDVQVRYTIMDYLGKEIRNGNILSEKSEISLRDLPSGNYFISLKSKKENRIFKIVKI